MSLGEEETSAFLWNYGCSENLVANGSSFIPAKDLGLEAEGTVIHAPPSTVAARFGLGPGGEGQQRGLSPNQVLFIWGHVSWIFWDHTNFL